MLIFAASSAGRARKASTTERLVDPNPFELAERLAIGEALLSLRRLLAQVRAGVTEEEQDSEESIA